MTVHAPIEAPRSQLEPVLPNLFATRPVPLPFDTAADIRAFLLRRAAGDILVYNTPATEGVEAGRQYLNHRHEAGFGPARAPLFVHEADREATAAHVEVRAAFSRRHALGEDFEAIPTTGHTPGATAYLWDSGQHRVLFTGDTIYLRGGEWRGALLPSSDLTTYLESLELLRELDFDVLAPWAASAEGPYYVATSHAEARRRIDAIAGRLRRGEAG